VEISQGTIVIAEASCYDTKEAYRNFGYLELVHEYPVELVDLNDGPFDHITVPDGTNESVGKADFKSLFLRISAFINPAVQIIVVLAVAFDCRP
jgi:uncharacterized protein (DUF362 family)